LDVAARELLAELERRFAEDVQQADLDRGLERPAEALQRRGDRLVGAGKGLQVAEDRVQVWSEVHQRPSRSRSGRRVRGDFRLRRSRSASRMRSSAWMRPHSWLIVLPCIAAPFAIRAIAVAVLVPPCRRRSDVDMTSL